MDHKDQIKFANNVVYFRDILPHIDKLKRLGGWIKGIPVSNITRPIVTPNRYVNPLISSDVMYNTNVQPTTPKPVYHQTYNPIQRIPILNNIVSPMPKIHV
jgi:hypothetical protein